MAEYELRYGGETYEISEGEAEKCKKRKPTVNSLVKWLDIELKDGRKLWVSLSSGVALSICEKPDNLTQVF